ncbi:MAG: DNA polymerase III subunit delta [Epulopiscium sp. Nele67-Bin004]|nr:MAG: DNA polymerase III subunit delta [Epulopiscium sp. Nele67-Bin004]
MNCHLLYGEEHWIRNKKLEQLKSGDSMNLNVYDGKRCDVNAIIDCGETLPFFCETKCIVIKDSGLFSTGRKDDTDKITKWLDEVPPYLTIIFSEATVDKRNKLYKKLQKIGNIEVCEFPDQDGVYKIICDTYGQNAISKAEFQYFYMNMPNNITHMLTEFEKLNSYCLDKPITTEDIDNVCSFGLEQRVFDLIKCMVNGDVKTALTIYNKLIELKESPIGILVLICRQYRIILQVKYMIVAKKTPAQISAETKLPAFVVRETTNLSSKFTFNQLSSILKICLEADKNIKTGKIEPIKCIELLIIRLTGNKIKK